MKQFKHQGDIPCYPFTGTVEGKTITHKGSFVLALGEATGHHHKITVANPSDLEIDQVEGGYIITLKSEATITHQEHLPIVLAPGKYRTGHEREKDWFSLATRRVID
jgi:hypothetical protein